MQPTAKHLEVASTFCRRLSDNDLPPPDHFDYAAASVIFKWEEPSRSSPMVRVGTQAPVVPVPAYIPGEHEPRVVTLDSYRGEWVVLFFYPRDFTFVCPTELRAFAELHEQFAAAGARLVAASTDSYWSHRTWYATEPSLAGVRYPVLADTALALGDAYGVLEPDGSALRATFVIDPRGTVRHASVSDQSVGRSPAETLRVVHALQTGELCRSTGAPARRRCGSPPSPRPPRPLRARGRRRSRRWRRSARSGRTAARTA